MRTIHTIARLQAEAARCERLALGMTNPELIRRLSNWADEYRYDASRLAARAG